MGYTGVLPISGSTANEFVYNLLDTQTHLRQKPKRVLPTNLRKVLLKGLASDPDTRYQNADHFWKEIRSKLKFSYDIVTEKIVAVAAILLVLWCVSLLWNKYSAHSNYTSLMQQAVAFYNEKNWAKAIELAEQVQKIKPCHQAKKLIVKITYVPVKS